MTARHLVAILALACAGIGALAQDTSLDGTWRMTIVPPGAKRESFGFVELNGASGRWEIFAHTAVQMMENPCMGHIFNLTVEPSEPDVALTFRVHAREVITGCPNPKVTLRMVGPNKLEGYTGLGAPVTLERN